MPLLKDGRRLLFGWTAALAVAVSACDSPTLERVTAPAESTRLIVLETTTTTATTADTATRADLFPKCTVSSSRCEGTDTIKIAQPGGDTVRVRTFDENSKNTMIFGGDTVVMQLGILDVNNATGGDFIYIIWRDGQFAGYFGHCAFVDGNNKEYITTDSTGKKLVHMENSHQDTTNNEVHHYVYDPETNKLKVYHRKNGETTERLIYDGPPIKNIANVPPKDPPAGQGPYTSEAQFSSTSGTGTTGTGTTGTGTTGTTGGTTTSPTPTTPSTPPPSTTSPTSPSGTSSWGMENELEESHAELAGAA
jgi:hypothetical protein